MKVLVTGSSGRLGSAIARQLERAHQVLGVDLIPGPAPSTVGDATDPHILKDLVQQVDAVIHTVSLHVPDLVSRSPDEFRRVNVEGTRALLEAATTAKVRRIVYTSTTSIYGHSLEPVDRAVWVTEDLPSKPRDIYDETKLAAEELFRTFAANEGLSIVCLRVARYFPEPPERLASYRLYRGVDIRDAARAHILALSDDQIRFEVFNISAQSPFARTDVEELYSNAPAVIQRYFPNAQRVFRDFGWRLPASIDRVYVVDRAGEALGYRPRHNFAELLEGRFGELNQSELAG